ncbi:hypothetical protein [uncultured Dubosiella sp.]|uniref:hypothetical protein n=1 Tax=uncultured Dubosiella sp. TaxID=1937011 RepID=UPI0025B4A473|nr:hypothetical protein [uncultured Dubosiella sp.]
MVIVSPKKDRFRAANMKDVKKNNIIHDAAGNPYRILEGVFNVESWNMLIQNMDRRKTKNIPCERISQYRVLEQA